MILLGPDTKQERLEAMLWGAGTGPKTSAVEKFILRFSLTLTAVILTREHVWLEDVVRRN